LLFVTADFSAFGIKGAGSTPFQPLSSVFSDDCLFVNLYRRRN
jgi:hypothetical protein